MLLDENTPEPKLVTPSEIATVFILLSLAKTPFPKPTTGKPPTLAGVVTTELVPTYPIIMTAPLFVR